MCDLGYSIMSHVNWGWKHKLIWNKSVRVALQIQQYCIFCVCFPFVLLHFQHIPPVVFSGFVAISLHFNEFEDINLTAKIHLWYGRGLLTCSRFPHGKMIFFTSTNHFLHRQSSVAKILANCCYSLKFNYIYFTAFSNLIWTSWCNSGEQILLHERPISMLPFCRLFF